MPCSPSVFKIQHCTINTFNTYWDSLTKMKLRYLEIATILMVILGLASQSIALASKGSSHKKSKGKSHEKSEESSQSREKSKSDEDESSRERPLSPESQAKFDQFVDYMFAAFRTMVKERGLQPFPVPEVAKKFSRRFFGAHFTGEATLFNGSITKGLESVARTGPTRLTTKRNKRGSKRTLSVEFEMTDLVVNESYKLKLMKLGPKGDLEIKMDYIRMFIQVVIRTRSRKGNSNINVKLGRVDIVEFSPFTFSLDGIGPLNLVVKIFTSVIAKLCKQAILHSIWNAVQQLMTQVINETTADSSVGLVAMMMKFL